MNTKIFRGLVAVAVIATVCVFSSCVKDDVVPPDEETVEVPLEGVKTRSVSTLINFGSIPQSWQKVKSGSSVNLYKHSTDGSVYITDIDLENARIGLTWAGSSTSPSDPDRNAGCYRYTKQTVKSMVENANDIFVASNFGFFWSSGESSYPLKQSTHVDVGASKTSSSDYTYNLYAMVVADGVGVKLNTFSTSNWANFAGTYTYDNKVYVVRNNQGNSPTDPTKYRTILAVTTQSGTYYKRMYLLVTNVGMTESTAKSYLQDFIEQQELMCSNLVFIPLDGGGSSQLFAKNVNSTNLHLSGDGRTVINALIIKDF
ncbi:MAG: hypothetical protein LBD75_01320 [Candidatus Peribacteria bacterium]|jgi:hypothetical protein|nr:hypothetical protein [Candidatus Peribacteria bacterium]